jgi:hypothetical protein
MFSFFKTKVSIDECASLYAQKMVFQAIMFNGLHDIKNIGEALAIISNIWSYGTMCIMMHKEPLALPLMQMTIQFAITMLEEEGNHEIRNIFTEAVAHYNSALAKADIKTGGDLIMYLHKEVCFRNNIEYDDVCEAEPVLMSIGELTDRIFAQIRHQTRNLKLIFK